MVDKKDEKEEASATSAEGKAEEEEAKGFTTPDDGESEPEPADGGGEGSKEDGAPAVPEEKKGEEKPEEKEKTGDDKTGDEPPKEAAATEDAAGKPKDKDQEEEEKVPKGVKKRIDRAVRNQHDAERERDYYKGLAEGRKKPEAEAGEEAATPEEVKRPVQEDFETEEEYIDALTDFKVDQKFVTRDAKNAEKAEVDKEAMATTSRQEAFGKRIGEARGKHEDYDDVVFRNPDLRITKPMLREFEEIDNGAEVAYHLGKNPEEAARIAALPQKAMERALWTIEEGLTPSAAAPKTDTKEVPGAPDPIEPSGGGGSGGGRIDYEKESIEDFMDREKKKDLKAHGY